MNGKTFIVLMLKINFISKKMLKITRVKIVMCYSSNKMIEYSCLLSESK